MALDCLRSGRQFAAWIGLTPRDHSTAGKVRLGVITRAGRRGIARRAGGRRYLGDPTCYAQRQGVALACRTSQARVAEAGRRGAGEQDRASPGR
jgi:transposase